MAAMASSCFVLARWPTGPARPIFVAPPLARGARQLGQQQRLDAARTVALAAAATAGGSSLRRWLRGGGGGSHGLALRPAGHRLRSHGSWPQAVSSRRAVATGIMPQQGVANPAGEWAFRSSVLGNDGALSGHVFLGDGGQAAYLADGVQVVGRGVGRWVQVGRAAAVELDVFQYAAAAAAIPDKPHRFRGVWTLNPGPGPHRGDWYFCPEGGEAPRLVGGFDTASTTLELLPVAMEGGRGGPAPRVASGVRDSLMAALDAQPAAALGSEPDPRLAPYKVGDVEEIYYIPDWIRPDQEADFMQIADGDMNQWEDMRTRSSQEWGAGDRCSCGRGLMRMPLPQSQQQLADALHHLGIFDGALYPMNSVRINGYRPGQGIFPHCDGPVYYPKVAILSLGSPCVISFYTRTGTEDCMKWDPANDVPGGFAEGSAPQVSVLLEPRSLLVFSHDAFWHHRHGIDAVSNDKVTSKVCNLEALQQRMNVGDTFKRSRRVSLTMRHLLPRCACQG